MIKYNAYRKAVAAIEKYGKPLKSGKEASKLVSYSIGISLILRTSDFKYAFLPLNLLPELEKIFAVRVIETTV